MNFDQIEDFKEVADTVRCKRAVGLRRVVLVVAHRMAPQAECLRRHFFCGARVGPLAAISKWGVTEIS